VHTPAVFAFLAFSEQLGFNNLRVFN